MQKCKCSMFRKAECPQGVAVPIAHICPPRMHQEVCVYLCEWLPSGQNIRGRPGLLGEPVHF